MPQYQSCLRAVRLCDMSRVLLVYDTLRATISHYLRYLRYTSIINTIYDP